MKRHDVESWKPEEVSYHIRKIGDGTSLTLHIEDVCAIFERAGVAVWNRERKTLRFLTRPLEQTLLRLQVESAGDLYAERIGLPRLGWREPPYIGQLGHGEASVTLQVDELCLIFERAGVAVWNRDAETLCFLTRPLSHNVLGLQVESSSHPEAEKIGLPGGHFKQPV